MSGNDLAQVRLLLRCDMEAVEMRPIAQGAVAVFTTRSPGKDTDNEDAAAVIPVGAGRGILAVADGLGGQRSGAVAAEMTLKALTERVAQAGPVAEAGDLRSAVLDGLERANTEVSELGIGAGTTLAVVEIADSTIRPYHVGDSMILVVGQRGKVKLQTVPHSPVGYAVEAGLLDEKEAIHHRDRHLVSNIVGSPEMRIEVGRTLGLNQHDTVVLGSDGLFDNLHVAEIADLVRKGPLAAAAVHMADACRRRMDEPDSGRPCKPDDLTFLVYRGGA